MSTVTPEFLEYYHYILNLMQQNAAESRAEFDKRMAESKAESDKRAAEWEEQHLKSKEDWDRRMAESKAEWEEQHRKWAAEDKKYKEEQAERDRQKAEEDRKYKEEKAEEDRKYKEEQAERDRKKAEEDRKYKEERAAEHQLWKEAQKQLDQRLGIQEDNYGKFVESFVRHQLVRVLNEFDIKVNYVDRNVVRDFADGKKYEFDAIVVNGDIAVFVEVKSTLRHHDVERFLQKMQNIRQMFREYKDKRIIAAVAFINDTIGTAEMAQNKGFLTILAIASSASVTNPPGFIPTEF